MSTDVTRYVTPRNTLHNMLRNTRNSCYARREKFFCNMLHPLKGVCNQVLCKENKRLKSNREIISLSPSSADADKGY